MNSLFDSRGFLRIFKSTSALLGFHVLSAEELAHILFAGDWGGGLRYFTLNHGSNIFLFLTVDKRVRKQGRGLLTIGNLYCTDQIPVEQLLRVRSPGREESTSYVHTFYSED